MVDIPQNQIKPNHIYLIYVNKEVLALNNQQWLICQKTKPNQIKSCIFSIYIYIYKDLALNDLQWLICHKNQTKPNQTKPNTPFFGRSLCREQSQSILSYTNRVFEYPRYSISIYTSTFRYLHLSPSLQSFFLFVCIGLSYHCISLLSSDQFGLAQGES